MGGEEQLTWEGVLMSRAGQCLPQSCLAAGTGSQGPSSPSVIYQFTYSSPGTTCPPGASTIRYTFLFVLLHFIH